MMEMTAVPVSADRQVGPDDFLHEEHRFTHTLRRFAVGTSGFWLLWILARVFYLNKQLLFGNLLRAEALIVYMMLLASLVAAVERVALRMCKRRQLFTLSTFVQYCVYLWATAFVVAFVPLRQGGFGVQAMILLLEPSLQALVITGLFSVAVCALNIENVNYTHVFFNFTFTKFVLLMFAQPIVILLCGLLASALFGAPSYAFLDTDAALHWLGGALVLLIASGVSWFSVNRLFVAMAQYAR